MEFPSTEFNFAGLNGLAPEFDTDTDSFKPTIPGKYNFRAQIQIKDAEVDPSSTVGGKITLALYDIKNGLPTNGGILIGENIISVEQDNNNITAPVDTNISVSSIANIVDGGSGVTDEYALFVMAEGLVSGTYNIATSGARTYFEGYQIITALKGLDGAPGSPGAAGADSTVPGPKGDAGEITIDSFLDWAATITNDSQADEVATAIGDIFDIVNDEWTQPAAPPPPMFAGKAERDLVKQVNDELIERVIGQMVLYYPISQESTNYHSIYGEAIDKTFLPPIRVYALVDWEGSETTSTNFGVDRRASITVHFHKRRLTEDQDLFVREGDFIQYGDNYYEIVALGQPKELFGRTEHKMEIVAKCTMAREGLFNVT